MTSLEITGGVPASIVPFEPTVAIVVVVTLAMVVAIGFMVFLALAPTVSPDWDAELRATPSGIDTAEAVEAD